MKRRYWPTCGLGLVLTVSAFVACGGGGAAQGEGAESPQAASPPSETASAEPGAPNVPWDQKTFEQKKEYMGIYVFPEMETLFGEFDPEEFATFECQTCHGQNMEEVQFEMPSSELPALPAENTIEVEMAEHPEMTKFMMDKVVPEMAKLLGKEPASAENPSGFGCFDCHVKE